MCCDAQKVANWVTANPPQGRQRLAHPELLRVKSSTPEREPVIDDAFYAGTYIERRKPADLELYIDGPQRRVVRGLLNTPPNEHRIYGTRYQGQKRLA